MFKKMQFGSQLKLSTPVAMVFSVSEMQGQWKDVNGNDIWEVSGIVVEKAGRSKGEKKRPIVLNDGPDGVLWGSGNLKGNLENGVLVWRNRRGEELYFWERAPEKTKLKPAAKKTAAAMAKQTYPMPSPAGASPPARTELRVVLDVVAGLAFADGADPAPQIAFYLSRFLTENSPFYSPMLTNILRNVYKSYGLCTVSLKTDCG